MWKRLTRGMLSIVFDESEDMLYSKGAISDLL
jgi:hypothetical protein